MPSPTACCPQGYPFIRVDHTPSLGAFRLTNSLTKDASGFRVVIDLKHRVLILKQIRIATYKSRQIADKPIFVEVSKCRQMESGGLLPPFAERASVGSSHSALKLADQIHKWAMAGIGLIGQIVGEI
jgi:hypothetical protein